MKNHFFMTYRGNKRQEVERILENIDLTNITTIIEPFAGSSALSYYIHTQYPNKFKYILNDNDAKLMELYQMAKEGTIQDFFNKINSMCFNDNGDFIDKDRYKEIVKKKDLEGWFIANKFYCRVSGLYPLNGRKTHIKNDLGQGFTDFLQSDAVHLSQNDAVDLVDRYKDDDTCLIFLDPPYMDLNNDFYNCGGKNIYEYLNYNKTFKSKIVVVVNETWINDIIFANYKAIKYNKLYQQSNRKVIHCLYTN